MSLTFSNFLQMLAKWAHKNAYYNQVMLFVCHMESHPSLPTFLLLLHHHTHPHHLLLRLVMTNGVVMKK